MAGLVDKDMPSPEIHKEIKRKRPKRNRRNRKEAGGDNKVATSGSKEARHTNNRHDQKLYFPFVLPREKNEKLPPWILDLGALSKILGANSAQVALHYEILQFARFATPTPDEERARHAVVGTIRTLAREVWPSCRVEAFGSFPTGLYLPGGDVDVVILNDITKSKKKMLYKFANRIQKRANFAQNVTVIAKAKVPLIKFTTTDGAIECDVSFGRQNGVQSVSIVQNFLRTHPLAKPLFLVAKCFIKQHMLNDVQHGGLGSYTLFNMVISHLQMFTSNFGPHAALDSENIDLGDLLQKLFYFYGNIFDAANMGIQTRDGGCYFERSSRFPVQNGQLRTRFCVEDPHDATNELGHNCYQTERIRSAFASASSALGTWKQGSSTSSSTPLGMILKFSSTLINRRPYKIACLEKAGEQPIHDLNKTGLFENRISAKEALSPVSPNDVTPTRLPLLGLGKWRGRLRKLTSAAARKLNQISTENRKGGSVEVVDVDSISARSSSRACGSGASIRNHNRNGQLSVTAGSKNASHCSTKRQNCEIIDLDCSDCIPSISEKSLEVTPRSPRIERSDETGDFHNQDQKRRRIV